jgi:hypothetical protein
MADEGQDQAHDEHHLEPRGRTEQDPDGSCEREVEVDRPERNRHRGEHHRRERAL